MESSRAHHAEEVNAAMKRRKQPLTREKKKREAAFWKMMKTAATGRPCFS